MKTAAGYLGPDWVMLGVPDPDSTGVLVYASDKLTRAELEVEIETADIYRLDSPIAGSLITDRRFQLTATSRTLVWATGATYGDAIRNLMEHWAPETPSARAIGAGPRQLPEGRQ